MTLIIVAAFALTFGIVGLVEMGKKKENPFLIGFVVVCVLAFVLYFGIGGIACLCTCGDNDPDDQATTSPAAQGSPAAQASGASMVINVNRSGYGAVASAA
jgi:hypothetical protein